MGGFNKNPNKEKETVSSTAYHIHSFLDRVVDDGRYSYLVPKLVKDHRMVTTTSSAALYVKLCQSGSTTSFKVTATRLKSHTPSSLLSRQVLISPLSIPEANSIDRLPLRSWQLHTREEEEKVCPPWLACTLLASLLNPQSPSCSSSNDEQVLVCTEMDAPRSLIRLCIASAAVAATVGPQEGQRFALALRLAFHGGVRRP